MLQSALIALAGHVPAPAYGPSPIPSGLRVRGRTRRPFAPPADSRAAPPSGGGTGCSGGFFNGSGRRRFPGILTTRYARSGARSMSNGNSGTGAGFSVSGRLCCTGVRRRGRAACGGGRATKGRGGWAVEGAPVPTAGGKGRRTAIRRRGPVGGRALAESLHAEPGAPV